MPHFDNIFLECLDFDITSDLKELQKNDDLQCPNCQSYDIGITPVNTGLKKVLVMRCVECDHGLCLPFVDDGLNPNKILDAWRTYQNAYEHISYIYKLNYK